MTCYYRFLACRGEPNCPHSEVEPDALDREEYGATEGEAKEEAPPED